MALSSSRVNGAAIDLHEVLPNHAVQYVTNHSAGDIYSVWLEGSLDGGNWYLVPGSSYDQNTAAGSSATVVILKVATAQPARYVRCAGVAGVGAPTITAHVSSGE